MGQVICNNKEKFNLYSTVIDDFLFEEGLSEEQLKSYMLKHYGTSYEIELINRIDRSKEKGTSSMVDNNLEETISCNSIGLSYDECLDKFF